MTFSIQPVRYEGASRNAEEAMRRTLAEADHWSSRVASRVRPFAKPSAPAYAAKHRSAASSS